MKRLTLALLTLLSGTAVADELHLCANKRTGALRMDDACRKNESPMVVNSQGIQGPQGISGAQGPKGDSGDAAFPSVEVSGLEEISGKWNFYFYSNEKSFNCRITIQGTGNLSWKKGFITGDCSNYLDKFHKVNQENIISATGSIEPGGYIDLSIDTDKYCSAHMVLTADRVRGVMTGLAEDNIYAVPQQSMEYAQQQQKCIGNYGTVTAVKVSD